MIPLLFVILVTIATVLLGIIATKRAQSASDFFVAGRQVSVFMNASAISGEYLSAASFMGVAGLVMRFGYDAMWYPVGYAAGYLFLLLFIAGPLRRFGAYTIPDFAEGRFDSPLFRKIAVSFVMFIGFFYTMPQMKAAGVTMGSIMQWPYWVGIVVVGTVITFNVALGGMKGITFVQAFQYWVKAFAIAVPLFVIMSVYGGYTSTVSKIASNASGFPVLSSDGNYKINGKAKAPTNVVAFQAVEADVKFKTATVIGKVSPSRKPEVGEDDLVLDGIIKAGPVSAGTSVHLMPIIVTKGGVPVEKDGKAVVTGVKLEFDEPAELSLMSGLPVPNAQRNSKWLAPFGTLTSKHGYPLLYTYSLIIALICGTAGLPHILVRFYTNPDGRSAKKTTFWVMVLIGVFYFFTPIWGAVGREFIPGLYIPNKTDYVVINLPGQIPGVWGDVLKGVTSAGAFAAFMSTFSGLLVSMSGAWAHDIFGRILKPQSSPIERITAFKFAAIVIGVISMVLGLFIETFDIAMLVGWAFAIAAASYFPLLLLGAWWRGLTATGAASGMLVGGMASLTAIIVFMLSERKVLVVADPLLKSLCEQPAIWAVPLSLGVMYVVSMATKTSIPSDVDEKMLRLHAPEGLGYSKDYIASDH
ncbi:MAG: cation acetate symporter [Armatimonadaceae bacterium]